MRNLVHYLQAVIILSLLFVWSGVSAQNMLKIPNTNNVEPAEGKHVGLLTLYSNYREARHKFLELARGKVLAEKELQGLMLGFENERMEVAKAREDLKGARGVEREPIEEKLKLATSNVSSLQAKIEESKKLIDATTKELEAEERVYQKSVRELRIGLWVFSKRFIWIISFFVLVLIISLIVQKNISKWVEDPLRAYKVQKLTKLFTWMVIVTALLFVFLENIKGALTLIGLVGAGIAISLQDIFKSMVGWVILVAGKGIKPGDRIKVGDLVGDVLDINLLHTRLLEAGHLGEGGGATGRGILITNNFVFSQPVINYHFGYNYVWTQIEITATFESDWEGILRELNSLISENTRQIFKSANVEIHKMCLKNDIPFTSKEPHVYMTIVANGYHFTMRFLTPPKGVFAIKHLLSTKIAKLFETYPRFEFAYPTERIVPTSEISHPLEMVTTSRKAA